MFVVKRRVMLLMSFLTSHILLNVGFKVARQILIDTGDLSLDSPEREETLWGVGYSDSLAHLSDEHAEEQSLCQPGLELFVLSFGH